MELEYVEQKQGEKEQKKRRRLDDFEKPIARVYLLCNIGHRDD